MNNSVAGERKQLRKQLRAMRRDLTSQQQQQAAQQIVKKLRAHPAFLRSKRISLYLADDGEIDMHHVICAAEEMGKQCYLPILHPLNRNTLWFGRYRHGDMLSVNYFGLSEPLLDIKMLPAWALDLVLMPLVGFDRQGNRLGMGGGFYDRTFSFKKIATDNRKTGRPGSPVLMGVAHHCQEITKLNEQPWDVSLDYIATDKEIITAI